jgi:ubiquitin-activating enzyme E1 C
MMYMGSEGIYSHTFVYDQKTTCPVCTAHTHHISLPSITTLNSLLQQLCDGEFRLKAPSVTSSGKTLYMRKPVALEKATRVNLDKPLKELITSGEELVITDPVFPDTSLGLVVEFTDVDVDMG